MTHEDEKTERTVPARSAWGWLRQVLPVSFALALTLTFGSADAWARTNLAPPAESTEVTSKGPATPAPETPGVDPAFDGTYAQREAAAAELEKFEGGDVVIIGSGGLILLLLILILIIEL
jgi:hypothetical protein